MKAGARGYDIAARRDQTGERWLIDARAVRIRDPTPRRTLGQESSDRAASGKRGKLLPQVLVRDRCG